MIYSKTLAPSPDKVIKAVATKPPIVPKQNQRLQKPPIVPKTKTKGYNRVTFQNNKGFINPSEIKNHSFLRSELMKQDKIYDDLVYAGKQSHRSNRERQPRDSVLFVQWVRGWYYGNTWRTKHRKPGNIKCWWVYRIVKTKNKWRKEKIIEMLETMNNEKYTNFSKTLK